jgi:hypothetical protein
VVPKINPEAFDKACKNTGIDSLHPQAKRQLLEAYLKDEKEQTWGTAPIYASSILPTLSALTENKIDELLAERLYAMDASALDPAVKKQQPERMIYIRAQIRRAMSVYLCREAEAARHVFDEGKWQGISQSSFASMVRQSKRALKNLQDMRNDPKKRYLAFQRLKADADVGGKLLLDQLSWHYGAYLVAQFIRDNESENFHDGKIGNILLDSDHPVIAVLNLILAPMPVEGIYDRLDLLLSQLVDDGKAAEIERLVKVLEACGLLPNKRGYFQK